MQRREVILLVSRALALIQLITAFLDATYLPERFLSLIHHSRENATMSLPAGEYWQTYYQLEIVTLVVRVGALLMLSILFWNCGPWVERTLLPNSEAAQAPPLI